MYKLKVQREKCNACGACALETNILHEGEGGIVEVIGEGIIADSDLEKIKNIISLCPTDALSLVEEQINVNQKLSDLKNKMQQPLVFTPPPLAEYAFDLEDKNAYAKELHVTSSLDGEYDYDYKSWDSANSAGQREFRQEIYSQVDALAQQVMVMYMQRKMNKVARYAEIPTNYKYSVHQNLIKNLRAFVNEIESYTGKQISLPSDFYTFRTKDTDYINARQDHVNEWLADNIRSEMKPASEFETCVGVDKTKDSVRVSSWFGDDEWKTVTKYCYYLRVEKMERFYNNVARAAWYGGKYTSKFCTEELNRFHKDIEEEWKNKISYLQKQF